MKKYLGILLVGIALMVVGFTSSGFAWTEQDCKEVNYNHPDCETPSPSPTVAVSPTPVKTLTPTTPPQTLPPCPTNLVGVATGCTRTPTPAPTATSNPTATPRQTLTPSVTTTPQPIKVLPNTSTTGTE